MADEYITKVDCEVKHKATMDFLVEIRDAHNETNVRLFKDNGSISMQTKIDRHGQILKTLIWVLGIMCTVLLFNFGEAIVDRFFQ